MPKKKQNLESGDRTSKDLPPDMAHMFLRRVPRELAQSFKAACVLLGSDMRSELIKAMRRFVKETAAGTRKK
jgi:hypothetical protein